MIRIEFFRGAALGMVALLMLPPTASAQTAPGGITPVDLPASAPPPEAIEIPDQLDDAEAAQAATNAAEAQKVRLRQQADQAERDAVAAAAAAQRRANEERLRAHEADVARIAAENEAARAAFEARTVPCPSDPSQRCLPPAPRPER